MPGVTWSLALIGDRDTAAGGADEPAVCGVELNSGGTCDRPATECPYHG